MSTRKWYQKKTNWGLLIYAAGEGMSFVPITLPFSPIVKTIGSILAGYGIADRVNKK